MTKKFMIEPINKQKMEHIINIIPDVYDSIEYKYYHPDRLTGLSTGFNDLDEILSGLYQNELTILSGRHSIGKSTFALEIAINIATNEDKTVLIFSPKTNIEEVVKNLLRIQSEIPFNTLNTGKLFSKDWLDLSEAIGLLGNSSIYIDATSGLALNEIKEKIIKMQNNKKIKEVGLVIIDDIEMLKDYVSDNNEVINNISLKLKELSTSTTSHIIAISKTPHNIEKRKDKRPKLNDFRETGSIDEYADNVIFIHRDEKNQDKAEIIIEKNKNGCTGICELSYKTNIGKFFNKPNSEKIIDKNNKSINEIKENFIFDNLHFTHCPDWIIGKIGKYCYILDEQKQPIKKFCCEDLWNGLSDNDFIIELNNKSGVIGNNGKFIIPPIYDDISGFNNKKYLVLKDGKYKILSKNGDIVKKLLYSHMEFCYFSLYIVSLNGKKGIINANAEVIIPIKYDEILYKYDSKTLFVSKNNKWKWINLKNETIVPMKYYGFIEMAADTVAAKNESGKFVILNNKGKQICETEFEDIGYCFNDQIGLYPAKFNGKYGFIDKFGNIKIDFQYKNADYFGSEYAEITDINDNVFYIDKDNNIKVNKDINENFSILYKLSQNRFIAHNNRYCYGIVDNKNNIISDFIYDLIYPVPKDSKYKNILCTQYANEKGFIDYDGNIIKIDKEKFDSIPETVLDYSVCKNLPIEETLEMVFEGKEIKE